MRAWSSVPVTRGSAAFSAAAGSGAAGTETEMVEMSAGQEPVGQRVVDRGDAGHGQQAGDRAEGVDVDEAAHAAQGQRGVAGAAQAADRGALGLGQRDAQGVERRRRELGSAFLGLDAARSTMRPRPPSAGASACAFVVSMPGHARHPRVGLPAVAQLELRGAGLDRQRLGRHDRHRLVGELAAANQPAPAAPTIKSRPQSRANGPGTSDLP